LVDSEIRGNRLFSLGRFVEHILFLDVSSSGQLDPKKLNYVAIFPVLAAAINQTTQF
jgi:hypothetical protein